ncbi:condensation domain-containing protein [Maribacter sp. 2210JD10-5]|uniref:condensation domain-containing protein n=1 Tax=Maribacter sp. 2210JD10-5 TaxID=3386272 RepID=UPI0039BC37AA
MKKKKISEMIMNLSSSDLELLHLKFRQLVGNSVLENNTRKPNRLIAYIEENNDYDKERLKNFLKSRLPDHMVPNDFISVEKFPYLPNGKIDRKKLLSVKEAIKGVDNILSNNKPTNETEELLVRVWEQVLEFSPVGINDNFFEIGGDSILSIQIISKARKLGLELSPNMLFEHQKIAELSLFLDKNIKTANVQETLVGEIDLSPIQHWFFDTHKNAPHYWNQGMMIGEIPVNMGSVLKVVIKEIVDKHDVLRQSFFQENGLWKSKITNSQVLDSYLYIDLSQEQDKQAAIEKYFIEVQENTQLKKGNLFRALHFGLGNENKDICILFAHHLIIDVVSWQLIMEQLMTALHDKINMGNFELPTRTTSIREWVEHLKSLDLREEREYWLNQVDKIKELPFKEIKKSSILSEDIETYTITLAQDTTHYLLSSANDSYHTKTDELLLTALVETFCAWSGETTLSINLERHGRETLGTEYDLSNTVGWFTSFFPISLEQDMGGLDRKIMNVKEQVRAIPRGGIGYGVLRYLRKDLGLAAKEPEIVFNYLGRLINEPDHSNEELVVTPIFENVHHQKSERNYILELNVYIIDDKLTVKCNYGTNFIGKNQLKTILESFIDNVEVLVNHCINQEGQRYSPSDFSEVDLNQDDLDNLLSSLE